VGLSKTHLLHSISHQQLATPNARTVYLSSERFMHEYVHAIRTGRMHEFGRNYRDGIDVLLVDDVQFLAGKESTQDEFFHMFNALRDSGTLSVITGAANGGVASSSLGSIVGSGSSGTVSQPTSRSSSVRSSRARGMRP